MGDDIGNLFGILLWLAYIREQVLLRLEKPSTLAGTAPHFILYVCRPIDF